MGGKIWGYLYSDDQRRLAAAHIQRYIMKTRILEMKKQDYISAFEEYDGFLTAFEEEYSGTPNPAGQGEAGELIEGVKNFILQELPLKEFELSELKDQYQF